jgi:hypothetical protein
VGRIVGPRDGATVGVVVGTREGALEGPTVGPWLGNLTEGTGVSPSTYGSLVVA